MYRGGLNYMRYSVSDTAEHGDYTAGPRIVTDETRKEMKRMLKEIQDGTFAQGVDRRERDRAARTSTPRARKEQDQPLEQVGAKLRAMMPFLDPVTVRPDGVTV